MPVKSKNYKSFKKSYPKAGKFLKYTGKAIDVAQKAYGIAKMVATLVNSEVKTYQVTPTNLTVTTTPQILNLVTPSRGTGVSDRIGDSIAVKSVLFKAAITWNTAGATNQLMRVIILVDKNTNASADWNTPSDLLQSAGNEISLRNINNRKRFKILSDTVYYRDTGVPVIECKNVYTKGIVRHGKNGQLMQHHMSYQGSNSYGGNHMYVLVHSNIAANAPTFSTTWEARFLDN